MCNRNFSRTETKTARGFLTWEVFRAAIPFLSSAERVIFGGFGEALLHPDYMAMLEQIKGLGPYVYFFTNGILLNADKGRGIVNAGLDMMCISVAGATRETYQRIRGVDAFDLVVENIRNVSAYKKATGRRKPLLSFNIVAMNSLLDELEDMILLAKTIGVEHIAMPNLVAQGREVAGESIWLDTAKARKVFYKASLRAEKEGIAFNPPNLEVGTVPCYDLFRNVFITWDGKVLSCPPERYVLGDLQESGLNEIWNSKGLEELRKEIWAKGPAKVCPGCSSADNSPEAFLNPWFNSRKYAYKIK
jgi:MoaA/NifB/PqqE/SkfB family radical SAM enzyme